MIGPQFQDRQPLPGEVLLIAEVFVGENEEIESRVLHSGEEGSVLDAAPAHLLRSGNFMAGERVADLHRNAFVEQHPHAAT